MDDEVFSASCPYTVAEPGTITVIDNVEYEGDEDDCYEEMEDDEDEAEMPLNSHMDSSSSRILDCPPMSTNRPVCLVCGRTQTSKIKLFKWPKDEPVRRSWISFFQLEPCCLDDFAEPYICCFHFDADQFLYTDNKIYWAKHAFPKYKRRRPSTVEPFPWEIAHTHRSLKQPQLLRTSLSNSSSSTTPIHNSGRVVKRRPHYDYKVAFRESFYKNKNKTSHEVAIVSLPENSNIFYEFSYNRTSLIDGTKFYACLSCRKAKSETKVKDVIRTIHLNGSVILSKGDPFSGHHFACRPFSSVEINRTYRYNVAQPMNVDVRMMYSPSTDVYMDEETTTEGPWSNVSGSGVIPSGDVPFYGETRGSDSKLMNQPTKSLEKIYTDMKTCLPRRKLPLIQRQLNPRRRFLPRCHLCCRLLKSTQLLALHLLTHVKNAPNCICCGSKTSPDDDVRSRRARLCVRCFRIRNCSKS